MSAMSDYLENEILDHILATASYTAPATVYVGLSTGSGTASNDAAIEFSAATGSWGTVSHFGLFDASSSGNLLIHGALTSSKVIETGDILKIAVGDMDISAD